MNTQDLKRIEDLESHLRISPTMPNAESLRRHIADLKAEAISTRTVIRFDANAIKIPYYGSVEDARFAAAQICVVDRDGNEIHGYEVHGNENCLYYKAKRHIFPIVESKPKRGFISRVLSLLGAK